MGFLTCRSHSSPVKAQSSQPRQHEKSFRNRAKWSSHVVILLWTHNVTDHCSFKVTWVRGLPTHLFSWCYFILPTSAHVWKWRRGALLYAIGANLGVGSPLTFGTALTHNWATPWFQPEVSDCPVTIRKPWPGCCLQLGSWCTSWLTSGESTMLLSKPSPGALRMSTRMVRSLKTASGKEGC